MTSSPIRIELNGAPHDLPASLTVSALLASENLQDRRVAVELNGEIVPRGRHAEQIVGDGDRVEIVHALGGG